MTAMLLAMRGRLGNPATPAELRRGAPIQYAYAGGKVVSGRVLGAYADDMPGWYRCELEDEHGKYASGCHIGQIRLLGGRG
jgi:hypothetical protein